jgi:hypothetical protein
MTTGNMDDLRAAFARAYRKHEEEDAKLYPARMTVEGRIGAWLGHDREFKEVVALVRAYLRERGYKIARKPAVR